VYDRGGAKITKGYNLLAKYIIHTVGPFFGHENGEEEKLLANCYRNSLELAKEYQLTTISFPCISTGAFRFPKDRAAQIAIDTVPEFTENNPEVFEEIRFIVFSDLDYDIYKKLLSND